MYKRTTILITMILLLGLVGCEDKKERCDQVAFSLKQHGIIRHGTYLDGSVQSTCIQEWDTQGNDKWRDCILMAKSKAELLRCGGPNVKPGKFD